jgi:hypothetical protein
VQVELLDEEWAVGEDRVGDTLNIHLEVVGFVGAVVDEQGHCAADGDLVVQHVGDPRDDVAPAAGVQQRDEVGLQHVLVHVHQVLQELLVGVDDVQFLVCDYAQTWLHINFELECVLQLIIQVVFNPFAN